MGKLKWIVRYESHLGAGAGGEMFRRQPCFSYSALRVLGCVQSLEDVPQRCSPDILRGNPSRPQTLSILITHPGLTEPPLGSFSHVNDNPGS